MKTKQKKQKKTAKQKAKTFFKILLIIVLIIAVICGALAIVSTVGNKSNSSFIDGSVSAVKYENQLEPIVDDDGCYTFVTDDNLKILHLTDVHIGAGFMSIKKDNNALNAVAAMVSAEKPDLVVITGDIAYPVPFQAGTFNNKSSALLFAQLMEKLGVYWAPVFGNHDTEMYSYYSRKTIGELYDNKKEYPHCLFQSGSEDIDGVGNYAIKVKNTKGDITQALFMFDSQSYTDNDYFGALWKYDCVHENQIKWYEDTLADFTKQNHNVTPKSLAFMHIPFQEMKDAYYEYVDNGCKDTQNVHYIYGKAGEHKNVIYSSTKNYGLFDSMLASNSTQGVFFGHDHLNNFSLEYKGIRLTYGYSIDYLAYSGISKYGSQRGCAIIDVNSDGTFDSHLENYYQEKYEAPRDKESITMDDFYDDGGEVVTEEN